MAFIIKRYEVLVVGYGAAFFFAKNKNQARMAAFHSLTGAGYQVSFKDFLKIVANIIEVKMPEGFGRDILVDGKPAHYVEYAGGNSIRFAYPDDDRVLLVHELDVTELETVQ